MSFDPRLHLIMTLKNRARADYVYFLTYRTRWCASSFSIQTTHYNLCLSRSDNDQYSHMNNSIYYHLFDSIINTYLIHACSINPKHRTSSSRIGLVVESHCQASRLPKRPCSAVKKLLSSLVLCSGIVS